jgi:hypothetical protein
MKQRIESEHMNIMITYVVSFLVIGENMPSSKKWNDGNNMEPNQSRNIQSLAPNVFLLFLEMTYLIESKIKFNSNSWKTWCPSWLRGLISL